MKQKLSPICLVTVLHTLFALLGHNVTSRPEVARTSSDVLNLTLHKARTEANLSHSERVSNMKVITKYEPNEFTKDSE